MEDHSEEQVNSSRQEVPVENQASMRASHEGLRANLKEGRKRFHFNLQQLEEVEDEDEQGAIAERISEEITQTTQWRDALCELDQLSEEEYLEWISDFEQYCELLDDEEEVQRFMRDLFTKILSKHSFCRVQVEFAKFEISQLEGMAEDAEDEGVLAKAKKLVADCLHPWLYYYSSETTSIEDDSVHNQVMKLASVLESKKGLVLREKFLTPLSTFPNKFTLHYLGMVNPDKHEKLSPAIEKKIDQLSKTETAFLKALAAFESGQWEELKAFFDKPLVALVSLYGTDHKMGVISSFFERLAPKHASNPHIWRCYLAAAEKVGCSDGQRLIIFERALSRCNTLVEFWLGYLNAKANLESFESLAEVRELCMNGISQQNKKSKPEVATELGLFFLRYQGFSSFKAIDEYKSSQTKFLQVLQEQLLGLSSKDKIMAVLFLEAAALSLEKFKDIEHAKSLVEKALKLSKNSGYRVWAQYAEVMKAAAVEAGNDSHAISSAREVFRKAVRYSTDGHSLLASAWLKFEAVYGSLKTLSKAQAYLKEQKVDPHDLGSGDQLGTKRPSPKGELTTLLVKEAPLAFNEAKMTTVLEEAFSSVTIVGCRKLKSNPGMFFVDVSSKEEAEEVIQTHQQLEQSEDPPKFKIMLSLPPEEQGKETQQRTVFLPSLAADIDENALRTAFLKFGLIEDIRLKTDNSRNDKHFAYLEFSLQESAEDAISASPLAVLEQQVKVEASKSKAQILEEKLKAAKEQKSEESSELVVRNLSFNTTEVHLKDFLTKTMKISADHLASIEIMKKDGGQMSLGWAKVRCSSPEAMAEALKIIEAAGEKKPLKLHGRFIDIMDSATYRKQKIIRMEQQTQQAKDREGHKASRGGERHDHNEKRRPPPFMSGKKREAKAESKWHSASKGGPAAGEGGDFKGFLGF